MNQSILSKLEQLSMRLEEINALLSDQSIASDQNKFRELSIEHSQLTPINDKYKSYLSTIDDIEAAEKLLSEQDDEMKQMAEEEISSGQKDQSNLVELGIENLYSFIPFIQTKNPRISARQAHSSKIQSCKRHTTK